jgi:hypothetical protein
VGEIDQIIDPKIKTPALGAGSVRFFREELATTFEPFYTRFIENQLFPSK